MSAVLRRSFSWRSPRTHDIPMILPNASALVVVQESGRPLPLLLLLMNRHASCCICKYRRSNCMAIFRTHHLIDYGAYIHNSWTRFRFLEQKEECVRSECCTKDVDGENLLEDCAEATRSDLGSLTIPELF